MLSILLPGCLSFLPVLVLQSTGQLTLMAARPQAGFATCSLSCSEAAAAPAGLPGAVTQMLCTEPKP